MSFSGDLRKFGKSTPEKAERVRRGVLVSLFGAIIESTPVGNPDLWKQKKAPPGYVGGRARGNWQTTVGKPVDKAVSRIDPTGSTATREVLGNLGKPGDTVQFFNNLPYIHRLEYDGWSTQAPEGMVRQNVARFERLMKGALKKL